MSEHSTCSSRGAGRGDDAGGHRDVTRPCAKVEPLVPPLHCSLRWQFATRTECRNQTELLQLALTPALLGALDEVRRAKGKMKVVLLNRLEAFGPAAARLLHGVGTNENPLAGSGTEPRSTSK